MGTRWARVARGLLASGVAVFVAALFHVAGGGAAPGILPLVVSLAFATLASIALTARSLSLWRLIVAVGLSQLLFHLLFGLGAGGGATFSGNGAGHLHAGMHLTMTMTAPMPGGSAMPAAHDEFTLGMWAAHLTAVLVTVIALRFGEQAFWGLFDTARMHVARFADRRLLDRLALAPAPLATGAAARAIVSGEPVRLRDLGVPLLRLRHRGPPALFAAV